MSVFYVLRRTDPNGADHRYYGGEFVGTDNQPKLFMTDNALGPETVRFTPERHAADTRDGLERDGHERLSVVRVETTMRVVS